MKVNLETKEVTVTKLKKFEVEDNETFLIVEEDDEKPNHAFILIEQHRQGQCVANGIGLGLAETLALRNALDLIIGDRK